jgi:hypothetical protein
MSFSGRKRRVHDWSYVVIAYTVVWGALIGYAMVLARRVSQAQEVARKLREALREDPTAAGETAHR